MGVGKKDGPQKEGDCLPLNEYLEFIKDIRDVLCSHKETIFVKASQFFARKSYQKNVGRSNGIKADLEGKKSGRQEYL